MKTLNNGQHAVLSRLLKNRKRGLTLKQLEQRTHLSRDGIRGRVSELRHKHRIPIRKVNGHYIVDNEVEIELTRVKK